jgi:hypothetical protein
MRAVTVMLPGLSLQSLHEKLPPERLTSRKLPLSLYAT